MRADFFGSTPKWPLTVLVFLAVPSIKDQRFEVDELHTIPVIDVFAGPGGLGEGFNSFSEKGARFDVRLSMEVDGVACDTLRLRSFFHLSKGTSAQQSHYAFLRGEINQHQLAQRHPEMWAEAEKRVLKVELGADESRLSVHRAIQTAVAGDDFVLIGGPPCQAYSIIGRSRRLGIGSSPTDSNASRNQKNLDAEFYSDPRHRLYREYLEVIAVHRPVVFIMENVKGLSSARVDREDMKGRMFQLIKQDLGDPYLALKSSIPAKITKTFGKLQHVKYQLYALGQDDLLFEEGAVQASDFILRCEDYGVPQARHRIILFGIRDDIVCRPKRLSKGLRVSAQEALASLPAIRSSVSDADLSWLDAIKSELWRIPQAMQVHLGIPDILHIIASESQRLTTGARWHESPASVSTSAGLKWLSDSQLGGVIQHEAR